MLDRLAITDQKIIDAVLSVATRPSVVETDGRITDEEVIDAILTVPAHYTVAALDTLEQMLKDLEVSLAAYRLIRGTDPTTGFGWVRTSLELMARQLAAGQITKEQFSSGVATMIAALQRAGFTNAVIQALLDDAISSVGNILSLDNTILPLLRAALLRAGLSFSIIALIIVILNKNRARGAQPINPPLTIGGTRPGWPNTGAEYPPAVPLPPITVPGQLPPIPAPISPVPPIAPRPGFGPGGTGIFPPSDLNPIFPLQPNPGSVPPTRPQPLRPGSLGPVQVLPGAGNIPPLNPNPGPGSVVVQSVSATPQAGVNPVQMPGTSKAGPSRPGAVQPGVKGGPGSVGPAGPAIGKLPPVPQSGLPQPSGIAGEPARVGGMIVTSSGGAIGGLSLGAAEISAVSASCSCGGPALMNGGQPEALPAAGAAAGALPAPIGGTQTMLWMGNAPLPPVTTLPDGRVVSRTAQLGVPNPNAVAPLPVGTIRCGG